jgi:hypothetical protein
VAAKRGNAEDAGKHFGRALEEAEASRLPMLGVLAARDWKWALGGGDGSAGVADEVVDAACTKMGKTRGQLGAEVSGVM